MRNYTTFNNFWGLQLPLIYAPPRILFTGAATMETGGRRFPDFAPIRPSATLGGTLLVILASNEN